VTVAAVALAVLAGATLQSATGFGFALVTAPVLFAAFAPGTALTLLTLLAPVLSLLVLLSERRGIDVRWRAIVPLALWGIPGLALGVVILRAVDKPVLQVAVGAAVVAAAALELRGRAPAAAEPAPWPAAPVGVVAGTLSTTVGVTGPPVLLYLLRTDADQHQLRDSLAATFLLFTPTVALALAVGGRLRLDDIGAVEVVVLLALVVVGRPLGRWLFLRMDAQRFRAVALGLALLAGVASVVAGLA